MTKNEFEICLDLTMSDIKTLLTQNITERELESYVYNEVDGYRTIANIASYLALAKSSQGVFDLLKKSHEPKDNVLPFKVVKNEDV